MSHWERVKEVFLAAVEAPAEERSRLLDSLCMNDGALRAEVESLLSADGDSGTIIAEVVQSEASALFASEPEPGKRVGAYRILRELGRGGMGAVFLATRDDEVYRKQVAVKVVKQGMDTAEVLQRFRYERQILANLEHPYIARLFDGGSTEEGQPFFVMEYVDGEPVSAYCQTHTLGNRQRCTLFLRILEAVSYAHRNLVVHRDLKPGNIFVTPDGTPKLLDFGVAKLIGGNSGSGDTVTTLMRPFTPEYASPEQVRGLPVTTATDIYSLGAVFYELLTDRRAQPIVTPTPAEIERAVCDVEVPRPSQIAPSVDEDLDNIVLMAMRKEPERRYQSVDQFAEDIKRYMDGQPVLARQSSLSYRLRKFVLRNRPEIAAVSVLIAGLSTGLAVSLVQAHRAEAQRRLAVHESNRATAEARRAEAAQSSEAQQREVAEKQTIFANEQRDFAQHETALAEERLKDMLQLAQQSLFAVHDSVAKLPGSMDARQQIVKTTLEFLERLQSENELTDEMRITLAAAYFKVSQIQGNHQGPSLEDFSGAEVSLKKGREILRPLYQRQSDDPAVLDSWIDIQSTLAEQAYQAGQTEESIRMLAALLPVAHRLGQLRRGDYWAESQESVIEQALAVETMKNPGPEGLQYAERGAAMTRALVARYPDERRAKQGLGSMLAAEAYARSIDTGELEKASDEFKESIRIREELLREQPLDTLGRRNLLVACGNYAALLGIPSWPNIGKPAEAQIYADRAVALAREEIKADPLDATARFDLGVALGRSGMIDPTPLGEKEALARLEEAESSVRPAVKANPKASTKAYQLSLILEAKGGRFAALGRAAEAIASYREGLNVLAPFAQEARVPTAILDILLHSDLARTLAETGDYPPAIEFANQAVTRAEERHVATPQEDAFSAGLARAYAALAYVEDLAGNATAAKRAAEKAEVTWRLVHNPGILSLFPSVMPENEKLLVWLAASTTPVN